MKKEKSIKTRPLNLRGFPDVLYWECKIQAAKQHKTLKDYVVGVLQSSIFGEPIKPTKTA